MAYCIAMLMPTFNLKVGEMLIGLVMSKLVGPSLTLLLLLEVLSFPISPKNKKLLFFLPLKLRTFLMLHLLRTVLGYVSSIQIRATINLPLSLVFVTTNFPFCCPRIPSFMTS
jgi:hypothetical protein